MISEAVVKVKVDDQVLLSAPEHWRVSVTETLYSTSISPSPYQQHGAPVWPTLCRVTTSGPSCTAFTLMLYSRRKHAPCPHSLQLVRESASWKR